MKNKKIIIGFLLLGTLTYFIYKKNKKVESKEAKKTDSVPDTKNTETINPTTNTTTSVDKSKLDGLIVKTDSNSANVVLDMAKPSSTVSVNLPGLAFDGGEAGGKVIARTPNKKW